MIKAFRRAFHASIEWSLFVYYQVRYTGIPYFTTIDGLPYYLSVSTNHIYSMSNEV